MWCANRVKLPLDKITKVWYNIDMNKWFLPFMVLFGDEGNTQQNNGCGGLGCMVMIVLVVLLFLSIGSSILAH